jgi:hypothetical protein
MGKCRKKHELMIPEKGCEKPVRKASGTQAVRKTSGKLPGSLSPGPCALDLLR